MRCNLLNGFSLSDLGRRSGTNVSLAMRNRFKINLLHCLTKLKVPL
jgi:hypothetical protein